MRLLVLEKDAKATAGDLHQDSQSPLNQAFRGWDLGSGQGSGEMCLDARMTRSEGALFFRLGPAHRAADRQDVPQRKLFSLHSNYYSTSAD
jgi:hypothetical protein